MTTFHSVGTYPDHSQQHPKNRWRVANFIKRLCLISLFALSGSLQAADFSYLNPMKKTELEMLRGGFQIAGIDMNFGATLQTLVDNVRMDTVFIIHQGGAEIVSQTVTQLKTIEDQFVSHVGQGSGQSIVDLTPSGINLSGMKDLPGFVVSDSKGFTSVFHTATRDAILGSVVSDASKRDIQHQLNLGVHINNMPAMRAAQQRHIISESLTR